MWIRFNLNKHLYYILSVYNTIQHDDNIEVNLMLIQVASSVP